MPRTTPRDGLDRMVLSARDPGVVRWLDPGFTFDRSNSPNARMIRFDTVRFDPFKFDAPIFDLFNFDAVRFDVVRFDRVAKSPSTTSRSLRRRSAWNN